MHVFKPINYFVVNLMTAGDGDENSLCGSRGDGGCSRVIVFLRGVIRKWRANWQLLYAHQ